MQLGLAYHCSHEQFKPHDLLRLVQRAEAAGFNEAFSSDHFQPWSLDQGESGYSLVFISAAIQATNLPFGTINCPGYRNYPPILAQAYATLSDLFPGRFWFALGSGQALNERITGKPWSAKPERNAMLRECAELIRDLLDGKEVNHYGRVTAEACRLFTLPKEKMPITGACITPETAHWLGSWADAMLTISKPVEKIKKVMNAFREGGGEGKPMYVKVQLSYAPKPEQARQLAFQQWRNNVYDSAVLADLRSPEQFDKMGKFTKPDELDDHVFISSDAQEHVDYLQRFIELGFSKLILHNVNVQQDAFIDFYGEKVLPRLKG